MEAPGSSETSALTRATRRNNPEDTIFHSHRRENLKSYTIKDVVFLVKTPCGSSKKKRHFVGTYRLHLQGNKTLNFPGLQRGRASRHTAKRTSCSGTSTVMSIREVPLEEPLFAVRREACARCEMGTFRVSLPEDGGDMFIRNVGSYY
jgi:hypothetical protein